MTDKGATILFFAVPGLFLAQSGCACGDWFVEFETSGRLVDSSGAPLAGASVEITLLRGGELFGPGSEFVVSEDDGSFTIPSGYLTGVCAPIGLIQLIPRDDGARPDAAQFRLRYEGCIREAMVGISGDQISGEYPSLTLELGDVGVPDCQ